MFDALLATHSIVRWLVLLAGAAAVALAWRGRLGGGPWSTSDDRAGRWFTVGMDVQLVLGLILYAVSPTTRQALGDMGAAMGDAALRFWSVEHGLLMVVAVVLTHIGRARSRRADGAAAKHRAAVLWYTLAFVAVLAAIPWPFRAAVGRALLPFG